MSCISGQAASRIAAAIECQQGDISTAFAYTPTSLQLLIVGKLHIKWDAVAYMPTTLQVSFSLPEGAGCEDKVGTSRRMRLGSPGRKRLASPRCPYSRSVSITHLLLLTHPSVLVGTDVSVAPGL